MLLIETSGVPEFAGQRAFNTGLGYREEARVREFYDSGDDEIIDWKAIHSATTPTGTACSQPGLEMQ